MNLDENQKRQVAGWLNEGASLAEVQNRLESEFDAKMTYMEVKFLVADLDLTPIDPEPEKEEEPEVEESVVPQADGDAIDIPAEELPSEAPAQAAEELEPEPEMLGNVSVEVDQINRPGSMLSGKVTFANGKTSEWMLDQMGRLGVVPAEDGYKPSESDLQQFQAALQDELKKMGL